MSLFPLLTIVAVVLIVFVVRRSALLSAKDACGYLREGGVIVDVRTPAEFREQPLPNSINLPLAGLPNSVMDRFPQKDRVLLLHCLGGSRGAVAKGALRAKGYTHAYNLGSYRRALRAISDCGNAPGRGSTGSSQS